MNLYISGSLADEYSLDYLNINMNTKELGTILDRPAGAIIRITGELAMQDLVKKESAPMVPTKIILTQKGEDILLAILSGKRKDIPEACQLSDAGLCCLLILGWNQKVNLGQFPHTLSESL